MKLFTDAYRSPFALLFLDDLERLIEYTPVGGRFNNSVLQTLLVLLKRPPPNAQSRLLVIATTSVAHLLEDVQLLSAFQVCVHVSQLQTQVEVASMLRHYANPQVCGEAEIVKVGDHGCIIFHLCPCVKSVMCVVLFTVPLRRVVVMCSFVVVEFSCVECSGVLDMWYILSMCSLQLSVCSARCALYAIHDLSDSDGDDSDVTVHTQVSQAVAQLGNPIGVKALLYALEMAQSDLEPGQKLQVGGFLECLHTMKA